MATEVTKEVTTKPQEAAPDAGSALKPKKRVRINPEASVVPLENVSEPGAGEGAASASASPPQRAGSKMAAGRIATAEPSPKIAEVVDPSSKVDDTEHGVELLLQKFSPLELYEKFGASMKVCLSSSPRVPSHC